MPPTSVNPYLKTKIMTASPEELRLMLYDGAIRFCHQGKTAMVAGDLESSYHSLMRAQKIVLELSTSLNPKIDRELCDKLASLYTYIYRLLVDANMHRRVDPVDEAVKLLQYERDTWQMLMQQLNEQNGPTEPSNVIGAQQTALSSLSKSA